MIAQTDWPSGCFTDTVPTESLHPLEPFFSLHFVALQSVIQIDFIVSSFVNDLPRIFCNVRVEEHFYLRKKKGMKMKP